jgi:hypothetical protein
MSRPSLASCISRTTNTSLEQHLNAIYDMDGEDSNKEPPAKQLQHQCCKDHKAACPFYVAADDVGLNGPSSPEGFVPSSGTRGVVARAPAVGEELINDRDLTPLNEEMDGEAGPGGAILVNNTVDDYYFMEYVSPSKSLHTNFTDSAPFPDDLDIAGCVSSCKVDSVCNNITCKHNTDFASCRSCKENAEKHSLNLAEVSWSTKWMADSGASKHFSRNKKILQNIKKLKTKDCFIVSTTDGTQVTIEEYISAIVFWQDDKKVCRTSISPVFYALEFTNNLILVGTLLQQDMDLSGNKGGLQFIKNGTELLCFAPCYPGSSVFCTDTSVTKLQEVASALKQEECISHETIHRQLAHPSNKVLQYACRHTLDFPTIIDSNPTSAPHICKGCKEGKKHKWEFKDCRDNQ